MRFCTFLDQSGPRAGVLVDDTVHALPVGHQLLDLVADPDRLREVGEEAIGDGSHSQPLLEVHLLAPIPTPPTVRDFMTFESHIAGVLGPTKPVSAQWYQAPAFYFSNPYAVIGPADPVPVAPGSLLFDLELEVAAVIGRGGSDLRPEEAEAHIAGYTILVDWSARDIQLNEMEVGLGPTKGKDTATTMGPVLVTPDELEPFRTHTTFGLEMTASVNGQQIGVDRLDSMAWTFGDMVAYASRGTEVRPGDVLGSGTCGGGCLAELWGRHGLGSHRALEPGDTVTVAVEQLGTMSLEVVAGVEQAPIPPARR